jgi:hypothetical protein
MHNVAFSPRARIKIHAAGCSILVHTVSIRHILRAGTLENTFPYGTTLEILLE